VTLREPQGHPEQGRGVSERTLEGVVTAQLPSGLYEVHVEGARITAHAGSGPEKNFVRLLIGDRVMIELTPRDLHRGRIVRKA
jgi:translation initiation factor IF-1